MEAPLSTNTISPEILELMERYPSLKEFILRQQEQISYLQTRVTALESEVKELRNRLDLDSHNSSKPPSTDPGRRSRSLRKRSGKSPGGQPGHRGSHLEWSSQVDHFQRHEVSRCDQCNADLSKIAPFETEHRQVFDLPPLRLEVTEHQVEQKCCPRCFTHNSSRFPVGVESLTQYGPRLKGLVVYLHQYQLLPYQRLSEMMADLFSASISPGSIYNTNESAYHRLFFKQRETMYFLLNSPVVHFDETGLYENGKRLWLHSASTEQVTLYFAHENRGRVAMDTAGILPEFRGIAVHDHWESYQRYEQCEHAFCNVHHLRELICAEEQEQMPWAKEMKNLLLEIKQRVDKAQTQGKVQLSQTLQKHYFSRYRKILREALKLYPTPEKIPKKRGRIKQSKSKNLLDRLFKYEKETLRFMTDFRVPFDNNLAERDIRMVKVKQKISGTFRSQEGTDFFCRIRGFISTVRKQKKNVLENLTQLFQNPATHYRIAE